MQLNRIAFLAFDLGTVIDPMVPFDYDFTIRRGSPKPNYLSLPSDNKARNFPIALFVKQMHNGESQERDWFSWSPSLSSLYCFPCRIAAKVRGACAKTALAKSQGWGLSIWVGKIV